jgi:hypothetical protein
VDAESAGDEPSPRPRHPAPPATFLDQLNLGTPLELAACSNIAPRLDTRRHRLTSATIEQHEPADIESAPICNSYCRAMTFCAVCCRCWPVFGRRSCRLVPGRVGPRRDRRSRMDHALDRDRTGVRPRGPLRRAVRWAAWPIRRRSRSLSTLIGRRARTAGVTLRNFDRVAAVPQAHGFAEMSALDHANYTAPSKARHTPSVSPMGRVRKPHSNR